MPKNIQCIAYQIQTAPKGKPDRTAYAGLADEKRDIDARCKVMMDAIEAAAKDPKINAMATKLFVAPEFFFRGARGGVYSAENLAYLSEVMDGYLKKADYYRWIFVLGTALAVMPGADNEILNVAFARIGGKSTTATKADAGDSLLVYKEFVSAVDFMGGQYGDMNAFYGAGGGKANIQGVEKTLKPVSGARPMGHMFGKDVPNDPKILGESSKTGLGGGTNFKLDGLQFICEICLDHGSYRAWGTIPDKDVDIHLVTSCGMMPTYAGCKRGGLFFLVDGGCLHKDAATLIQRTAAGNFVKQASISTINMSEKPRWKNHAGAADNLFEAGRGNVYVFPKMEV